VIEACASKDIREVGHAEQKDDERSGDGRISLFRPTCKPKTGLDACILLHTHPCSLIGVHQNLELVPRPGHGAEAQRSRKACILHTAAQARCREQSAAPRRRQRQLYRDHVTASLRRLSEASSTPRSLSCECGADPGSSCYRADGGGGSPILTLALSITLSPRLPDAAGLHLMA